MPRRDEQVKVEVFRSTFKTWNTLFDEAASFASAIGRDRVINISHSEDKDDGVVAVWYWDRTESVRQTSTNDNS